MFVGLSKRKVLPGAVSNAAVLRCRHIGASVPVHVYLFAFLGASVPVHVYLFASLGASVPVHVYLFASRGLQSWFK